MKWVDYMDGYQPCVEPSYLSDLCTMLLGKWYQLFGVSRNSIKCHGQNFLVITLEQLNWERDL